MSVSVGGDGATRAVGRGIRGTRPNLRSPKRLPTPPPPTTQKTDLDELLAAGEGGLREVGVPVPVHQRGEGVHVPVVEHLLRDNIYIYRYMSVLHISLSRRWVVVAG